MVVRPVLVLKRLVKGLKTIHRPVVGPPFWLIIKLKHFFRQYCLVNGYQALFIIA
jgi:hypothetical protein